MRPGTLLRAAGLALGLQACGPSIPDTLVVPVPFDLETLDPHARDRVGAFGLTVHFYETLVASDAEMRIVPSLALRWNNPDDRTWVFDLRPDARFHDGSPVEAEDVAYSFERLRREPGLEIGVYTAGIESVRATGPRAVEIRTARPVAGLLNKLLSIAIVKRGSTPEALAAAENGSGPFRLSAWRRGETVEMERIGEMPPTAFRRVVFRLRRPEAQALEELRAAAAGLAPVSSAAAVGAVEGDLRLEQRPGVFVVYLGFDLRQPRADGGPNPFLALEVRQAVSAAIDRSRLRAFGLPAGQVLPPFLLGHDPGLATPPVDEARARALLARAGYPRGLVVTLHARQALAEAVPALVEMLGRAGLEVRPEILPDEEFFARASDPAGGGLTFFLSRYGCSTGDPADVLEAGLHSRDPARRFGVANVGRYADPALDQAIEESTAELAPLRRRDLLRRVMGRLAADLPWVPLYFKSNAYAVRGDVRWTPRADGNLLAWEASRSR